MTATEFTTIMVIDTMVLLLWLTTETACRAVQRALDADTLRRIVAGTAHYDFRQGGSAGSVGVETPPGTELRAAVPATARRGSAVRTTSVEPHPATGLPGIGPVAGLKLQAGDSRLDRDSAVTTSSDESQPAPALPSTVGAGLEPPVSGRYGARPTTPWGGAHDRAEPAPGFRSLSPGAGRSSRSESAPPDPAPIGVEPPPRGEDVAAARPPDLAAATIGSAA